MSSSVTFVGPVERVLFLRTVLVYRDLPPEVLAAIAGHTREHFLPSGIQAVERSGGPERVLLVVEGGLRATSSYGREIVIGPGGTIGLLSRLARTPCPVSAYAESDTLVLEIDWPAHVDVCEEHFALLLQYLRTLSTEILARGEPPPASASADSRPETHRLPRPRPPGSGLDRVQRALWLGVTPTFRRVNRDALFELAGHVSECRWRDDELVWKRGDASDGLLLLTDGQLATDCGEVSSTAHPGSLHGLEEALAGRPRSARLRACGSVSALRVDVEPFIDILEDHFEAAFGIATELARRLLPLTGGILPGESTARG